MSYTKHMRFNLEIGLDCCTKLSQEQLKLNIQRALDDIGVICVNNIPSITVNNVMLCTCNDLDEDESNE